MKKHLLLGITLICLIMSGVSCKKTSPGKDPDDNGGGTNNGGGGTVVVDPNKEILPSDANGLSKVLVFPSATVVTSATLPATSAAAEAPAVLNFDQDVAYSAGSKVVVLTDVNALSNIKGVYIQLKGGSQYWDVPINAGTKSGSVSMPFTLPKNIGEGTFTIILKFYDINGKVSASTEIKVTVSKQVNCGVTKVSGGQGLTSNLFKVPESGGQIKIAYETFTVKDKIDVYQNGTWIGGTGPATERSKLRKALDCSVATEAKGYVGKKSEFLFTYDASLGTDIEVVVSGCEDGGTKWEYTFSCPGDYSKINVPELTTTAITAIDKDKAQSGGEILTDNGYDVIARGVVWSTSPAPTVSLTTKTVNGIGKGIFTSALTALTANTKYYVRAYATNSVGTGYGNEISFTTSTAITLPVLSTSSISAIAVNTAQGGGNITGAGGATITSRGIVWGTATAPTIALSTKTTSGSGTGSFTAALSGLAANTKYYVRAFATNSAGTAYGNEVTFTTQASINLSLDGKWENDGGTAVTITGTSGVLTALSPGWQEAHSRGLISIGDVKFKNIVKTSTYKWTCLERNIETQNGISVRALWSEDGTITMSNDGKTFTIVSNNIILGGNRVSTIVWTRK